MGDTLSTANSLPPENCSALGIRRSCLRRGADTVYRHGRSVTRIALTEPLIEGKLSLFDLTCVVCLVV